MTNGLAYLAQNLQCWSPLGRGNFLAKCPCHDDSKPSLSITLRRNDVGRWQIFVNCPVCGANGLDVCRALNVKASRALWPIADDIAAMERPRQSIPLPPPAAIEHWQRQFKGKVRRRFESWRGITSGSILRNAQIGWDGSRYTVPVYENGRLVNVKRATLGGKLKSWDGTDARKLYPDPGTDPGTGWLLIVEGEWDALMARQHGLPAWTGIGGAGTWPEDALRRLVAGRNAVVCLDADDAGRKATPYLTGLLAGHAAAVKVLVLAEEGADLTKWFKAGGTRRQFLEMVRASHVIS